MTPRSDLAAAWAERLRAIYGDDLGRGARVVHVAAVAEEADGRLSVIASGPRAPTSPTDAFTLAAARARVDAIVTTGEILRREPRLSHALSPAAAAWRREVLGIDQPPLVVILTRRPEEAVAHATAAAGRCVVLTPSARPADTRRGGIRVLARSFASLAAAVARLEAECGTRSVLIEAGPRTARELYDAPPLVDELLLSVYQGPSLAPAALVGAFATSSRITACLGPPVNEHSEGGRGARWRFLRYLRVRST